MTDLVARAARYSVVATTIAEQIRSGALTPGDRLPSERDLAERFEVSRVTGRRAITELTEAGLVEAHQGRGTFVRDSLVTDQANALMSFTELGRERGLVPSARVLHRATRASTLVEAQDFGIGPGAALLELRRVRLLDDLPVSVDRSLVPAGLVPSANEVDFTSASLYAVLESHGHGPRRTEYIVGAIAADAASAALLEVPEGSPLLATHTKAFDAQGRLVEVGDMVYRGDRYQFHASLTKDPG